MADVTAPKHIIVMGVSGCGKSTLGSGLASRLGLPFIEGDDLHPAANIARMREGLPLDDAMRKPWLESVAAALRAYREGSVASCSALKRSYRRALSMGGPIFFVHPMVEQVSLMERVTKRQHFMPASLIESQLQTLEPLEAEEWGCTISGILPLAQQVDQIISGFRADAPS
ncbi:gluconokinase [Martelella limonii]|uniref:gluconokinase n=1 Tax=Martelella limonii TaxID=1647649 RepID=UPI0019D602DE|nr:gluconokinase [Martelella limonii]